MLKIFFIFLFLLSGLFAAEDKYLLQKLVTKIEVTGNYVYSDEYILEQARVATRLGGPVDVLEVQEDLRRILALGVFQKVGVAFLSSGAGVKVLFVVKENPVLNKVVFQGSKSIQEEKLKTQVDSQAGDVLNLNYLDKDIQNVNNFYKYYGYEYSAVARSFLQDDNLYFLITEPVIHDFIVTGNNYTHRKLITREFLVQPGDIYNSKKIQADRARIFQLGYFSKVSLPEILPAEKPNEIDVRIAVTEKKKSNLNFGVGVSSGEQFGFLKLTFLNALQTGEQITMRFQSGQERKRSKNNYYFRYYLPYLWYKNMSFGYTKYLNVAYESRRSEDNEITDTLPIRRDGYSVDLGFPLWFNNKYKVITEYKDERVAESAATPRVNYLKRLVAGTFIYDGLEKNTETGIVGGGELFRVRYEKGGKLGFFDQSIDLGGVQFSRLEMMYNRFVEVVNEKNIVGVNYRVGSFVSARDQNVLEGEEYSVGGSNTVRGYADVTPFAIGPKMTVVNLEYRYLFNSFFQGVLFYDWGNAYSDMHISVKEFKSGYGLGARIITPIGPIRFDLGRGELYWIFHFGLGYTF